MFCSTCGAQIPDGSANCSVCGAAQVPAQQTYQQPTYQQPTYQQPTYQQPTYQQPMYQQPMYGAKPVVPGKGMAVASLVLGILGAVFALIDFVQIMDVIDYIGYFYDFEDFIGEFVVLLALTIPSVALGVVAKNKGNNSGLMKGGLVTGIIGLALTVLSAIMILAA